MYGKIFEPQCGSKYTKVSINVIKLVFVHDMKLKAVTGLQFLFCNTLVSAPIPNTKNGLAGTVSFTD